MRTASVFARVICIAMILLFLTQCGGPMPSTIPPPATEAPTFAPTATVAQQGAPETAATPLTKATRHALFTQAWTLIRDRYVYEDHGGADWDAVGKEYSDKVAGAASDDDFYDLMREMVDQLGDKHSSFLPPEAAALEMAVYEDLKVPGGIGVFFSEDAGELMIVQVLPDYPAAGAGLKPGDRILAVDGVSRDQFASNDEVALAILGEAGSEVVLSVRSDGAQERDVAITRAVVELGDALVQVRAIEGTEVGFLTIGGFDSPDIPDLVRERLVALLSSEALKGLIVDVRTNPGGYTEAMLGTLALFIDGGSIGSEAGRGEQSEIRIPSGRTLPLLQGLPVAVLSGPHTSGTAESFVAGMQLHQRAKVVGQPTAGNTESVSWHQLSDGSLLRIAESIYKLPDGTVIEDRGVQPDVMVEGELRQYGSSDDPQLKAAIEILGSD